MLRNEGLVMGCVGGYLTRSKHVGVILSVFKVF